MIQFAPAFTPFNWHSCRQLAFYVIFTSRETDWRYLAALPVEARHPPRREYLIRGKLVASLNYILPVLLLAPAAFAQTPATPASAPPSAAQATEEGGTSNDLFIMFGSDLVRPGLLPKANYNIGLGHTFGFLKKDPFGDELTFAYTYENAGSHGFLHTGFGSHTEALGLMKNFALPKTKRVTGYTWIQGGLTTMTGFTSVENRFYDGEALGAIVHLSDQNSIWIQETFNKIVTVPWYTTASIGYTRSW